jgi:hypothetical protein
MQIETNIRTSEVAEQRAVESGDGRTALSSRKAIATQKEALERLAIEEAAITKRLQEFDNNKGEAEKIIAEIERLHNEDAPIHVNKIVRAQADIVDNLKTIEGINNSIDNLATQYLILCGEPLYAPTIMIPGMLRQFARQTTTPGPEGIPLGLQPVEPFTFRKKEERAR